MIAVIAIGEGVDIAHQALLLAVAGAGGDASHVEAVRGGGVAALAETDVDLYAPEGTAEGGAAFTFYSEQWKQRLCVFSAFNRSYEAALDCAMAADIIVFSSEVEAGIDELGLRIISAINAQGVPSVLGALGGVDAAKQTQKRWRDWVKTRTKDFQELFVASPRVLPLDTVEDGQAFVRFLSQVKLRGISWREQHAYVVADAVAFEPAAGGSGDSADDEGVLCVRGFVRGLPMSASDIVYAHAFGHRHVQSIEVGAAPCQTKKLRRRREAGDTDDGVGEVYTPDSREQQSLQLLADVDAMAGEQTMTAEEREIVHGVQGGAAGNSALTVKQLLEMEEAQSVKRKRVPKGTGEYQACWIASDEEEEGDGEGGGDGGAASLMRDVGDDSEDEHELQDFDFARPGESAVQMDAEDEADENARRQAMRDALADDDEDDDASISMFGSEFNVRNTAFAIDRKERLAEVKEDMEYPDEVVTPDDMPARFRFAKYEGLASFRTTPWDVYQNLPPEYARVYRFRHMKKTRKNAILYQKMKPIEPGSYVTLRIAGVSLSEFQSCYDPTKLFIVSSLLRHEQRLSVLHFLVKRTAEYTEPVKSKDRMLMCCGFRRFYSNPVYSEHAPKCDKQKYERFFHRERTSIATIYGPVTFPPAPLLMLHDVGGVSLVATGSLASVNPNRPIIKRIVLTGTPCKIRKKKCVARDMFYDPADIKYFKSIELWTKQGKAGHIIDSIGTHGHMKCRFNQHIQANDTLMMSLYKRVYPVWGSTTFVNGPLDPSLA